MAQKIDSAFELLEKAHEGFLATLEEGKPFVSAAGFLYERKSGKFGKIFLFLSDLARHTKNLRSNPQVSLAAAEAGPEPVYERRRVTAQGSIQAVEDPALIKTLQSKYAKIFQGSDMLFGFRDFHFFGIDITEIHLVAGFGSIETFK